MKNRKRSPNKSSIAKYAYYSGTAFQMLAIIGVFTYVGYRIDERKQSEAPIITAVLALLGVCISIYTVIRAVTSKKKP